MTPKLAALRARLGPGLIFAAAAVGTSHVVQSTRAGAGYGLTLGALILVICVLKYPLFRFAADYAAITGESLVRGYGRHGRWLVALMFATSAVEAVAATAGIALVSASILQWLLGTEFGESTSAVGLLLFTACLISVGRYRVLESITTVLVVLFSLLTLVVTAASLPQLLTSSGPLFGSFPPTEPNWSFAIAVSGWMPIGNTAAIMLAAWILARARLEQRSLDAVRFDFNLGYLASVVLALCFLVIGAAVLFNKGTDMPRASGEFVAVFIGLYTNAIGSWASLLVSVAALAVMYSTMLAIVDGFPRLIGEFAAELWASWGGAAGVGARGADPGGTGVPDIDTERLAERLYFPSMAVVVCAASALLFVFLRGFATFIDLVTITGFLSAPVIALANQLVINGANVPLALRPRPAMLRWNQLAVVLLSLATAGFLYLRLA